jgi:hypothetical protein
MDITTRTAAWAKGETRVLRLLPRLDASQACSDGVFAMAMALVTDSARPEDQEWTEGMSDRDSAPITPAGAAQRSHARGHHSADNST